jgi:hypothetical protein
MTRMRKQQVYMFLIQLLCLISMQQLMTLFFHAMQCNYSIVQLYFLK